MMGVGAILTIENIYHDNKYGSFFVFFLMESVTDIANTVITSLIVLNNLELESRGTVLALKTIFKTIVSILMTLLNGHLGSIYLVPGSKTAKDYIRGTKLMMIIGCNVLAAFLVVITIYRCKTWGRK